MRKILTMLMVTLLMLWSVCAWAELKEGMWEFTMQAEMKGMPQKMPPTKYRHCVTKSDPVPKNQSKNYDCKTVAQKMIGNTINYTIECKGPEGTMTSTGNHTYTGTAMDGASTTVMKLKGQQPMEVKNKMTGKYLGPCK